MFGDQAILKLLRRPFTGHHPDLEVPAALTRNGSKLVAAPLGWIEMPAAGQTAAVQAATTAPERSAASGPDSESAVLAILSVYFAHSADGWSLATASLRAAKPDFSGQARLLGETTAQLHAELAERIRIERPVVLYPARPGRRPADRAQPGDQGRARAARARACDPRLLRNA